MGNISKNFNYSEFELSPTAKAHKIDNRIPSDIKPHVKELVTKILQPLRDKVGKVITISSGYRCKELNALVGGASTSQHTKGEASDIKIAGMKPLDVAQLIYDMDLPYDQMILYPSFVHVSYKYGSRYQRKMLLYNVGYFGSKVKTV